MNNKHIEYNSSCYKAEKCQRKIKQHIKKKTGLRLAGRTFMMICTNANLIKLDTTEMCTDSDLSEALSENSASSPVSWDRIVPHTAVTDQIHIMCYIFKQILP